MKNLKYIFLLLVLFVIANFSYGQKIDEKLLYSGDGLNNVDAYSFYTDGKGNYAFIEYDQNLNLSRIITNKGNSDYYEVVNSDAKFDKDGNNYSTAYNYRKDTTYLADKFYLLVNGQVKAEMTNIDSYNAFINSDNEYQCIITENDKQYIARYSSDKGLVKTGPHDIIKSIYAEWSDTPDTETDHKEMPSLFKNKAGDYGYVILNNDKASIMFGSSITNTDYSDINESSFTYDRNGALSYIAKTNGQFYTGMGNECVVQGDKKWNDFNYVNMPVKFTKDNQPVYAVMDSIDENTYMTRLVVGNDNFKVYSNASKTNQVTGYSAGIYDIAVMDNGNINFTGNSQIITKNPDGYDDYSYKTINVNNGIEGKAYFNQSTIKYNKAGATLVAGTTNQKDKKVSLFMLKGADSKVVSKKKYDGINDYDFINGGSKYYYIGTTYGDYDKGKRDVSDVYIDGDMVGTYETISGQNSEYGSYNSIIFSPSGEYAFVIQNSNEKKVDGDIYYDYTSEIISSVDVDTPELPYKKEKFAYIDNLRFLKNGKLFYIGYLYPDDMITESYMVLDGKIIAKPYNSLNDIKYNRDSNTMTFRASRGNKLYNVTMKF